MKEMINYVSNCSEKSRPWENVKTLYKYRQWIRITDGNISSTVFSY